jgi:hypothetical protein
MRRTRWNRPNCGCDRAGRWSCRSKKARCLREGRSDTAGGNALGAVETGKRVGGAAVR